MMCSCLICTCHSHITDEPGGDLYRLCLRLNPLAFGRYDENHTGRFFKKADPFFLEYI
jgi:hypothetical protein